MRRQEKTGQLWAKPRGSDRVHIMADHMDPPTIKTTTKARAGVTGHNTRYVLAVGLAGVIIAFVLIVLYFYDVQF
jgi:Flp pilus assembly protein TadB